MDATTVILKKENANKQNIYIMTQEEKTNIEERIVDVLKTVYDPEIPVNIYDLGMIYKIDVKDDYTVELDMTFTAPNCPAADYILEDVRTKVESVEGVKGSNVNLVFEPAWDQSMMSEEARVELGFD
jgi:FeS assembly SUF system protein